MKHQAEFRTMKREGSTLPAYSHPAIRYQRIPVVEGPIFGLEKQRPAILESVCNQTLSELSADSLGLLLEEALYGEQVRLKHSRPNWFTRKRFKADRELWNGVKKGLLQSDGQRSAEQLLQKVVSHYAEEVGGHFDPRVYQMSTHVVPWGFNWLLNAASVQRFLPWGLTESLESRLNIVGEVPLVQKLAKQGTLLMVPTHQSNLDSAVVAYAIYLMSLPPFAFGAGLNLFSNPVLSFFMSRLGAYTVDRRKSNLIYKQVLKNYSTGILRHGMHSVFFPGGGRSRSGAIERKLKLGLLGTGLEAEIQNLKAGTPNPKVFIVPMVLSYHFVLEAGSLIEDFLAESGKHRYIMMDDESWEMSKVLRFFWRFFSQQSSFTVRLGRPLDVFGNLVDENGESIGPDGKQFDHAQALKVHGELCSDANRDRDFTRHLGQQLGDRFYRDNTVLTSHGAAFLFFEALRRRHPTLDVFRLLRIPQNQRILNFRELLVEADAFRQKLRHMADRNSFYLEPSWDSPAWFENGIKQLGQLHGAAVIKTNGDSIWTEDMNLLCYYRNRLTGYELSDNFGL